MKVSVAVKARHAARAFLDTPVPMETVRNLIENAGRAPSGGNLQPWRVYALAGKPLAEPKSTVKAKLACREREEGEYVIYPPNLWEPLRSRRREAGVLRYKALGIAREKGGQ